jgi:hypothetical protein
MGPWELRSFERRKAARAETKKEPSKIPVDAVGT